MAKCMIMRRGGGISDFGLPEFTYTGQYTLLDDGSGNWRIKFLTSGTLTITNKNTSVDVFIVSGGGGAAGANEGGSVHNAAGGGGYTLTVPRVVLEVNTPYEVVIGAGGVGYGSYNVTAGNGGTTSFGTFYEKIGGYGGYTSDSYQRGGNGGSGGASGISAYGGTDGGNGGVGSGGDSNYGQGQGSTTREFGEADGTLYSTGGNTRHSAGVPVNGAPNTGDGGSTYGGYGGSGICIIRNARAAT